MVIPDLMVGIVLGLLLGSPMIYFALTKPVKIKPPDEESGQVTQQDIKE